MRRLTPHIFGYINIAEFLNRIFPFGKIEISSFFLTNWLTFNGGYKGGFLCIPAHNAATAAQQFQVMRLLSWFSNSFTASLKFTATGNDTFAVRISSEDWRFATIPCLPEKWNLPALGGSKSLGITFSGSYFYLKNIRSFKDVIDSSTSLLSAFLAITRSMKTLLHRPYFLWTIRALHHRGSNCSYAFNQVGW